MAVFSSGWCSRKAALSFSSSTCAWLSMTTGSTSPSRMTWWTSWRIFGIRSSRSSSDDASMRLRSTRTRRGNSVGALDEVKQDGVEHEGLAE